MYMQTVVVSAGSGAFPNKKSSGLLHVSDYQAEGEGAGRNFLTAKSQSVEEQ